MWCTHGLYLARAECTADTAAVELVYGFNSAVVAASAGQNDALAMAPCAAKCTGSETDTAGQRCTRAERDTAVAAPIRWPRRGFSERYEFGPDACAAFEAFTGKRSARVPRLLLGSALRHFGFSDVVAGSRSLYIAV